MKKQSNPPPPSGITRPPPPQAPPRVSASNSIGLLSAVGLTRIQETKLRYFIEKGGNHSAVTVHVDMLDGSLAEIDPFGRVTWRVR